MIALSTNNATGETDNKVNDVSHSRGTMEASIGAGALANAGFKNPNLSYYVNNPAAQADRFIERAGQVTDPKNIYIWAPSNDPVATFTGGYGNDYWNSIKAFPSIFVSSNSVHSSPGSGALGSKTEYVPAPISYPKDDKALNQLQEKHRENMQTVYQQVLDKPKEVPVAKQPDGTQKLQEQVQKQSNQDMNQLSNQNSQNVMMINVPSSTVQKIQQLQRHLN